MKLKKWIEREKSNIRQFSKKAGVHPSIIWHVLYSGRVPRKSTMARITEATNGEIRLINLLEPDAEN